MFYMNFTLQYFVRENKTNHSTIWFLAVCQEGWIGLQSFVEIVLASF